MGVLFGRLAGRSLGPAAERAQNTLGVGQLAEERQKFESPTRAKGKPDDVNNLKRIVPSEKLDRHLEWVLALRTGYKWLRQHVLGNGTGAVGKQSSRNRCDYCRCQLMSTSMFSFVVLP